MQSPEGLDYTPFNMADSKTEFFKMANSKKKDCENFMDWFLGW